MNWNTTLRNITENAAGLSPLKVLVTIVSAPFFVIGCAVGLVWMVGALAWSAVWVGVDTTRRRARGESEVP